MPYIKSKAEIEKIKQGGIFLGEILEKLCKMVKPGISTWEIEQEAERLIMEAGGLPSFKGFRNKETDPPFPCAICASINEELVHAIASKEKMLKEGDIFSIDLGMKFPAGNSKIPACQSKAAGRQDTRNKEIGYYTDTSITVSVGEVSNEAKKLLSVTKQALEVGIKQCIVGNTVADIGKAIQEFVEPYGYGIVRDLVGHGVGHAVHEDPRVPNFYDKDSEKWKLETGVVIAIEPMITIGDYQIETAADGWSISTKDKSLCAHFEHTVIVSENGPIVVTRRPNESF